MLIRNKPGAAAKIVSRVTSIVDEGYVLECYRVSPRYCAALSPEFVAATMRFAEVLHGLGYTRRVLAMAEVFDRRFIDRVHPEPPHYG
jgi:NitT/TauT family transport system substrate-binding protein